MPNRLTALDFGRFHVPLASRGWLACLTVAGAWLLGQAAVAQEPAPAQKANAVATTTTFEVGFPSVVGDKPLTTRVYVLLGAKDARQEPRFGPDWFRPQPFFARDVTDWKPGETVKIDASALGYPGPVNTLEPGEYDAQAVVRLNYDTHKLGDGEGNAYGPVVRIQVKAEPASPVALTVDKIVSPQPFHETDRVKLAVLESPLLSAFYHRPIKHRAAVILPEGDLTVKRPVLFIIPGFGGDHTRAEMFAKSPRMAFGTEFVRVLLDPDCGTGHHVFADSKTNGPRGQAFIEEFIPYLEQNFPIIADPKARLLNGHSSGGWSSLWLQVAYPDVFGGTWSTSPDPVDFRDFQKIDIYADGENMFRDREGKTRPIARMGDTPVIFYDRFSKLEEVLGPGGQLGSFEAVFSPLDAQGQPRKLWNRSTGELDKETAKAWEAYDIRLVLEQNWPAIGPKLAGKLHVITGSKDTFFLEGAVELLKESQAKLNSDAQIEIIPGRDHSNILDADLAKRIDDGMKAAVAKSLGQ